MQLQWLWFLFVWLGEASQLKNRKIWDNVPNRGGGGVKKRNKYVSNSISDIWKPMGGSRFFKNVSISNWDFWKSLILVKVSHFFNGNVRFSPKWKIFMKISLKNAKVLTTLLCSLVLISNFWTRRVGHCQKCLKFKNVSIRSDRGVSIFQITLKFKKVSNIR